MSNDSTAPNYWGNVLGTTTADGNTTIHLHDAINNGADTSAITLVGVTTDAATLVSQHAVTFIDWHLI